MRLIFVRHGDAHAGLHGIIGGPRGCHGLTDLGRRQAGLLRDQLADGRIEADVLLASELPRAIETAEIIAPALGMETVVRDCDLCEVHTGDADGMDWADYTAHYGSLDMAAEPDRFFAPGGDSWNSFHERVRNVMRRLAIEHRDRTVVAVSHAGVITASLKALFDVPPSAPGALLRPTNTGLTEWEHHPEGDAWLLRYYNDASHLMEAPAG